MYLNPLGGEYPLSAAITSETAKPEERARALATVFSMQGFGIICCSLVLIIATHTITSVDSQWRFALAMGAVPMIISIYFRWKMIDTEWKTQSTEPVPSTQESDSSVLMNKTDHPKQSITDSIHNFGTIIHHNKHKLLCTAGTWFLLDIVFYANGLFSGVISAAIGGIKTPKGKSVSSFILNVISIPGYITTIFFCNRFGLKRIQENGFIAIFLLFLFFALLHNELKKVFSFLFPKIKKAY
jgi:MFS family permease